MSGTTGEVHAIRMKNPNQNIVLVDTPGFDDTTGTDSTIHDNAQKLPAQVRNTLQSIEREVKNQNDHDLEAERMRTLAELKSVMKEAVRQSFSEAANFGILFMEAKRR